MFNAMKSSSDNVKVTIQENKQPQQKKDTSTLGLGQAVTTFLFFPRIKLIYNISLSRKMYILYLYTLQDAPALLCIPMGGMYYRSIWLHYKAISGKTLCSTSNHSEVRSNHMIICRQFQPLLLTAAKLCCIIFIKM